MTEATVVGMSQGGFIPLRMSLAAPDRVRGFALIDTAIEDGLPESRGFIQIAGGGHAPPTSPIRNFSTPTSWTSCMTSIERNWRCDHEPDEFCLRGNLSGGSN